jgi:hypothetical protein
MQTESVEIVTTKEKFFREYLILKKPVIESILWKINRKKTSLSDMPLQILAELLYYNDQYKDEPEERKWGIVFSRDVRMNIANKLELKEHQLNNYLSHLRAIKILEGRTIRDIFIVYPNEGRELSFKFRLNGHTK